MTNKLDGMVVVGVDVSKAWLDVACGSRVERIANDETAIAALIDRIGAGRIAVVAYEPTGGYERALVMAASERGVPLRRVHANAVAAFRAACRHGAKTDRLDARLIATYAETIPARHAEEVRPDPILRGLIARRRQLVDMRHAERCRKDLAEPALAPTHAALIACIETQIATVEDLIAQRIERHHGHLAETLTAVTGVATLTAATLIADLPELGRRSGKTIAALVGLAAQTRQSGTLARRASIGHGRRGVRMALFNATRAALRWNPTIRDFFNALVARNKPGRVAFTAAMRKLLVILNAKVRDALAQPA